VLERAEAAMFAWLDAHYPRVRERFDRQAMHELRREVLRASPGRAHDLTWLRRRVLAEMASSSGYPDTLVDGAFEVFDAARNRVRFFDDALPALAALSGRYRLVALSNGNARLGPTGIARYFRAHVSARDAGVAKPDARMFRAAEQAMGARPHEVLHIGDDPRRDVQAALDAGQQAVWVNRDGRDWPEAAGARPREVRTLHELVRLLGG
jgi:putative hydrolase of the HAD superfamily